MFSAASVVSAPEKSTLPEQKKIIGQTTDSKRNTAPSSEIFKNCSADFFIQVSLQSLKIFSKELLSRLRNQVYKTMFTFRSIISDSNEIKISKHDLTHYFPLATIVTTFYVFVSFSFDYPVDFFLIQALFKVRLIHLIFSNPSIE